MPPEPRSGDARPVRAQLFSHQVSLILVQDSHDDFLPQVELLDILPSLRDRYGTAHVIVQPLQHFLCVTLTQPNHKLIHLQLLLFRFLPLPFTFSSLTIWL